MSEELLPPIWARLDAEGVVIETTPVDPAGRYEAYLVWEQVPGEVTPGSQRLADGTWEIKEIPIIPIPEAPAPLPRVVIVSPVEFKLLFTAQERVAIKTARTTDPVVDDFFSIVDDLRLTQVNLSLASIQQALGYLASLNLLTPDRVAEILTGELK